MGFIRTDPVQEADVAKMVAVVTGLFGAAVLLDGAIIGGLAFIGAAVFLHIIVGDSLHGLPRRTAAMVGYAILLCFAVGVVVTG